MKKKRFLILGIFVIIWAAVIFAMSNMNTQQSNSKSKLVIYQLLSYSIKATNKLGITNKHPSDERIYQVINLLNKPLRKLAHATEYFVLIILVIMALQSLGISRKKIFSLAIIFCFIYACSDEYHQSFVNGRTAQFSDSLIDVFGGLVGCSVYLMTSKLLFGIKKDN